MSDAIAPLTKKCRTCGDVKPLDAFSRNKMKTLGRNDECKDCYTVYYREWYAKNADRQRAKARQRAAADPQAARDRVKQWRIDNPERARENSRRSKQKRLERERGAAVEHIDFDALWAKQQGHCALCGEPIDPALAGPHPQSKSVDHIVPLSKGGKTMQANVQFTHLQCNALKAQRIGNQETA